MANARTDGQGFTLVEVLVALTILSIALTVMLQAFGDNLNRLGENEKETAALAFAQSLLAGTGSMTPLKLGDASGDFGNGYAWRLHAEPHGGTAARDASPVGVFWITASVSWAGGQKNVTLKTLRLAPKAPR